MEAVYNNLCILHDRYTLPEKWFRNFKAYGNYFDCLNLKTEDEKGNRFGVDWMKFRYPLSSRYSINRAMAYSEWDEEVIIPGGSIVIKKHQVEKFMLDERLHWVELEDMQFSKIAYLHGLMINIDSNNNFISRAVNHNTKKFNWYRIVIVNTYLWIRGLLGNLIHYSRMINKYYK
jgi:hypothetical protein